MEQIETIDFRMQKYKRLVSHVEEKSIDAENLTLLQLQVIEEVMPNAHLEKVGGKWRLFFGG